VKIKLEDEDEEDNPLSTEYQFYVIVSKPVDLSIYNKDDTKKDNNNHLIIPPKMAATGISMESILTF